MVLVPVMPLYIDDLQGFSHTTTSVSAISAIALATPAVGTLLTASLWGKYADCVCAKRLLLISIGLLTISLFILAITNNFILFIFARLLLGISGVSITLTSFAQLLTHRERKGTGLGQLQSAIAAACLLGPTLGGFFFNAYGLQSLLLAQALTCIFTLLIAALTLPSINRSTSKQHNYVKLTWRFFSQPTTFFWLVAGGCVQAAAFSLIAFFVIYLSEVPTTPLSTGSATGLLHSASWGAAFLSVRFFGRLNDKGLNYHQFILSSVASGICIFLLTNADNLVFIAVLRIIQGFFFGALIQTVIFSISQSVSEQHEGQAIGVTQTVLVLGQLIGPAIYPFSLYFDAFKTRLHPDTHFALLLTSLLFFCAALFCFLSHLTKTPRKVLDHAKTIA